MFEPSTESDFYAAARAPASNVCPRLSSAHAIRANLFASATTTVLPCARESSPRTQAPSRDYRPHRSAVRMRPSNVRWSSCPLKSLIWTSSEAASITHAWARRKSSARENFATSRTIARRSSVAANGWRASSARTAGSSVSIAIPSISLARVATRFAASFKAGHETRNPSAVVNGRKHLA